MFVLVVVLVGLVGLFLWLKQTTVKEKTIHTKAFVCMNDLVEFLCRPVNLEKYHPNIQKVTDVEEDKELVNFRIEENMGVAGKKVFPMMLQTYRDSQFTAKLRFESTSNYAKVILTFSMVDTAGEVASPAIGASSGSRQQPMTSIKLIIHVEAPRFFNFFIASHLVDVWTKALNTTKSILES